MFPAEVFGGPRRWSNDEATCDVISSNGRRYPETEALLISAVYQGDDFGAPFQERLKQQDALNSPKMQDSLRCLNYTTASSTEASPTKIVKSQRLAHGRCYATSLIAGYPFNQIFS